VPVASGHYHEVGRYPPDRHRLAVLATTVAMRCTIDGSHDAVGRCAGWLVPAYHVACPEHGASPAAGSWRNMLDAMAAVVVMHGRRLAS
jgi:hypothetical protein